MKPSTEDRTEGTIHEVKGTFKEGAGKLSMDSNLEAEGKDEQELGTIQKAVGNVEKFPGN